MVVDESGACIVGATVRVVRGQALGREITQATHATTGILKASILAIWLQAWT